MKKLHYTMLLAAVAACLSACGRQSVSSDKPSNGELLSDGSKQVLLTTDIAYREGNDAWKLDLANPQDDGKDLRPALVIIHGGGWSAGDKGDKVYRNMLVEYAMKGYVTISVNYRMQPKYSFVNCIEDVKCSVRWLRAHAAELRVDPERIGSYGHSAGAHLSMMLAVSSANAALEGDGPWKEYSSKVACAGAGSPPTEIGRPVGDLAEHPEWWPIGYYDAESAPMCLIQGLQDPVVKPALTEDFVTKKRAAGSDIEFYELEGNHGVAFDAQLEVTEPILDSFFAKWLKGIRSDSPKSHIIRQKNVDDGGSGPYASFAVTEKNLSEDVIYRPCNLGAAAKAEGGKLPVMIFANGGCNNTSITHERVLTDIASHGYVIVALGPMQMSLNDREIVPTKGSDMIFALDWLTAQNQDESSEYFGLLDMDKVAFGGQSCGGAEILSQAADPRILTFIMYNSGMGEFSMSDASKENLSLLGKRPIVYIVGGEPDIAYKNALLDYDNMPEGTPVAFANLVGGGHMGTFAEKYGGSFARMAERWLDWQFKGTDNAALFRDCKTDGFPGWEMKSKNL